MEIEGGLKKSGQHRKHFYIYHIHIVAQALLFVNRIIYFLYLSFLRCACGGCFLVVFFRVGSLCVFCAVFACLSRASLARADHFQPF